MTRKDVKPNETEEEYVNLYKGNEMQSFSIGALKKEIVQFIQIENLNILIGAGCSSYKDDDNKECAIPTMQFMSEEFYNQHKDDPVFNVVIRGDKIFDDVSVRTNLEALINRLTSIGIAFESEKPQIEAMKKIINTYIFDKISQKPCEELLGIYREMYMRMEKTTRKTPINVYTTNYDLYNENALDDLEVPYNNGFLGSACKIFNPNSYNYMLVENLNLSNETWKIVSNFIDLYKIHGSINWIKDKKDRIIQMDTEIAKDRSDSMMIYPTPQKDRSTLMVPYSDLFRMMQNNLLKSNSVLITIGYSFSDEHINRVIFNALASFDFRLVIFGEGKHIQKIIDKNNRRIWVINSDYKIHYFKNVIKKVFPQINEDLQKKREDKESIVGLFNDMLEKQQ